MLPLRFVCFVLIAVSGWPELGLAQKTTNANLNVSGTGSVTGAFAASGSGQGTISPIGAVTLSLTGSEPLGANLKPTGSAQLTLTFAFNSTDRFSATFTYVDAPSVTVSAPVSAGAGAYSGATGSVTLTLVQGTSFGSGHTGRNWTMTGSGSITAGQKTTSISFSSFAFTTQLTANLTWSATATGTLAPFGNVNMTSTTSATYSGGPTQGQGTAVLKLNTADSVSVSYSIADLSQSVSDFPGTVTGGTGAFTGATGSMNLVLTQTNPGQTNQGAFTLTGSGSITQPAGTLAPPKISQLTNNFSYILPGMPNYGIAQGSIFDIFGTGLSTATSALQGLPLPKALNGTSVDVTVNGVTTHAILYFVSPAQIAAILPSATPAGTGQISVTVNGQTSAPAKITVVQSAFGMLSLNGAGDGPAAAFDAGSHYVGLTNAANPGDFITLWGSGVGPVTGDETITQTPVNLTNIPIEVDIGGKSATVQYAGRSIYPGLDQINVQVPAGVSGCHVSVAVRAGDIVSNFGTIPVASSGRTCSEPVTGLTEGQLQSLLSQTTITRGAADFAVGADSGADVQFARFTSAQYAEKQPGGVVSFNDCTVYNFTGTKMVTANPIKPSALLDAGASISLTTPSGSGFGMQSLPFVDGAYSISGLMSTGSLKGTYTFTGTGGADIGPFSAQVTWPGGGGGFTFSTPGNPTSVTRSEGLEVAWSQPSNTDPNEFIQVSGFAFVPNAPLGAEFACNVPLAEGRFVIPSTVLLALPSQAGLAMPQAQLEVDLVINKIFTAPGADLGIISFDLQNPEPFSYQ